MIESNPLQRSSCQATKTCSVSVERSPTCTRRSLTNARQWAVEVKRIAGLEAVEQLTRYVDFLNRDTLLAPVGGILAAQTIKPQARTLAEDRGLVCAVVDYDALRGIDPAIPTLF